MKNLEFVTVKETRIAKLCDNIHYKVTFENGEIVSSKFIDNDDNRWNYIPKPYNEMKNFTLKELKNMHTDIIDFNSIKNLDELKANLYKIRNKSIDSFYNSEIEFKYDTIIINIHSVVIKPVEIEVAMQRFLKCEDVKVIEIDNTFDPEFDYSIKVIGLTDKDLFFKYFKNDNHQQLYNDILADLKK